MAAADRLLKIYRDIEKLEEFGSGAAIRRALSIVATALNEQAGEVIMPRCSGGGDVGGGCLPGERPCKKPHHEGEVLSFSEGYYEVDSEERRRSLFFDPRELLAAQFVDLYTDRIDVFELRSAADISPFLNEAHAKAVQTIRQRTAPIRVMSVTEKNVLKTIEQLRSLAFILERRAAGKEEIHCVLTDVDPLTADTCVHIRVEAGATKWLNNGRRLEQEFRDVFQCRRNDSCCANAIYTKFGEWVWKVVWEDDGNPMHPPPILPELFQEYHWSNRCAVFSSLVTAAVTSDWGWRQEPKGVLDFHGGMDIAAVVGTEVFAVAAGEVVHINDNGVDGNRGVIIRTGGDVRTYWHVDPSSNLSYGAVSAGTLLGTVAAWAHPHLHFALHSPPNGDWQQRENWNSREPCP